RDTPRGRAAAAHWLGVRRQLHSDEVFPTLPPAAIAIWNRYLGYGAAMGAAGEAVRQLPLGAEDPRHAWSSFGGRWRMVTVRYPRMRLGWGRSPLSLLGGGVIRTLIGLAPVVIVILLNRSRTTSASLVAPVLLFAAVMIGFAIWYFVLAALDANHKRMIVGRVLRVQEVKSSDRNHTTLYYWVGVDDGTRPYVDAWRVPPAKMQGIREGIDVQALVTAQCGYTENITARSGNLA
ncbi:MAG TPA: hypothetical protein VJU79_02110, partial [Candidatus Dormibacteraeota bacterium]|nr:hypothetical protein [Candidatus Dormibacteraeota bacterium]